MKTKNQIQQKEKRFNLPGDTIEEIILRLPVKSLLRFKSVSKFCKSFISSASFVKLHRETIQTVGKKFLFLSTDHYQPQLLDYNEASFTAVDLSFYFPWNRWKFNNEINFIGCCNGLVAAIVKYEIFLWNPSMGEVKKLPDHMPYFPNYEPTIHRTLHGFGYDSSSDDYKLILGLYNALKWRKTKLAIYSWRTGSWRMIKRRFPSFCFRYSGTGIHINGCIHWLTEDKNIFGFDLKTENSSKIPVPNPLSSQRIGTFDGKLCVREYNDQRKQLQLWVMKKYGDGKSWAKLLTLDNKVGVFDPFDLPLCISKDDALIYMEIMGWVNYHYDPLCGRKHNIFKMYPIPQEIHNQLLITCCDMNLTDGWIYEAFEYQESLVSPNTINS